MNGKEIIMTRRIGTTTYRVKIHFTDTGKENMEDKILRLISNHPLASGSSCDIIDIPQMSRSA